MEKLTGHVKVLDRISDSEIDSHSFVRVGDAVPYEIGIFSNNLSLIGWIFTDSIERCDHVLTHLEHILNDEDTRPKISTTLDIQGVEIYWEVDQPEESILIEIDLPGLDN